MCQVNLFVLSYKRYCDNTPVFSFSLTAGSYLSYMLASYCCWCCYYYSV